MADNEEGEGTTSRGNEWEVVSLTASAYAAAPGPEHVDENVNDNGNTVEGDAAGTSQALFMSRHFVFPPSEHENLPLEVENSEVQNIQGVEDVIPEQAAKEGDKLGTKAEDDWNTEGLTVPDEFSGVQMFDARKDDGLSITAANFEDTNMQGLNVTGKEHNIYSAPDLSSFNTERAVTGSSIYDENPVLSEETEPALGVLELDPLHSPKSSEGDNHVKPELPCEAWWKRGAASLYAQAKEANAIWSIFIAAAVMGLVIIGQHWQQERWQVLQLKWQLTVNDEKTGKMLGPLARLKDVIVGGNRRGSVLTAGSSTER